MFGFKKKSSPPPLDVKEQPASPPATAFRWRGRLFAALLMLLLAFVGLVITDMYPQNSWWYWSVLCVVYAIICIWLSLFLRRSKVSEHHVLWRELVHWIALLVAVYLVHLQVNAGIVGNLEGGLLISVLLALTTFIAGLYIDSTFLLIGIVLALFVAAFTLVQVYLTLVAIPIIIVAGIIIFLMSHHSRNHY